MDGAEILATLQNSEELINGVCQIISDIDMFSSDVTSRFDNVDAAITDVDSDIQNFSTAVTGRFNDVDAAIADLDSDIQIFSNSVAGNFDEVDAAIADLDADIVLLQVDIDLDALKVFVEPTGKGGSDTFVILSAERGTEQPVDLNIDCFDDELLQYREQPFTSTQISQGTMLVEFEDLPPLPSGKGSKGCDRIHRFEAVSKVPTRGGTRSRRTLLRGR